MSDKNKKPSSSDRNSRLIDLMLERVPESRQAKERAKWEKHFELSDLLAEKSEGKRGYWWPDSEFGAKLNDFDLGEWAEVEESADDALKKIISNLSGFDPESGNLNDLVLRTAERGGDFIEAIGLAEPSPKFFEQLAEAMREGESRKVLPEHERLFKPGTMNDFASYLMVMKWCRGIRLKNVEMPPFSCWTDKAIAEFMQWAIDFPADWQAIRDRRNYYGLKQPKGILIDRLEYERISGDGEEIEIGDGIRLGYCRKTRTRKAT